VPNAAKEGGNEDDGGDVVETELVVIEVKEQEGISDWCRKHSKNFGRPSSTAASLATQTPASTAMPSSSAKGKGKARATDEDMEVDGEGGTSSRIDLSNNPMAEEEGDLDDDNYHGSDSESLSDGSDAEDSDGSADSPEGEDSDVDEEGEREGDGSRLESESDEVEDVDEGPLDPKHHPLLRPGAMPKKVSKAVLNAVVGMVEEEFGMTGAASDEEDELDDDEL